MFQKIVINIHLKSWKYFNTNKEGIFLIKSFRQENKARSSRGSKNLEEQEVTNTGELKNLCEL